jgi:hypothetical protein
MTTQRTRKLETRAKLLQYASIISRATFQTSPSSVHFRLFSISVNEAKKSFQTERTCIESGLNFPSYRYKLTESA